MTVVQPLAADEAPLLARPFYAGGDPGPIAGTLAHVPELLEAALSFIGAVLSPSCIDFRTKEIVILRASSQLQCRYCVDTHTPVALDAGLAPAQVRALRGEPCHAVAEHFDHAAERALIAWTDEIALGRGSATDDAIAAMKSFYRDHEIVELTLVATVTLLLNRYASMLRLPVSEGTVARLAADGFSRAK